MTIFLRILGGIGYFVAIVVFYILFPIWASKYAKKRGLEGLRKVAIVSIFILLGPLGGLIAWLGSAYRPLVGHYQKECPKCKSKTIKAYLNSIDWNTGIELGAPFHIWLNFALFFAIAAGLINSAIGLYIEFFEWGGFTGPGPAALFFLSGIVSLWYGISKTRKYYQKDRGELIVHKCQDCGNDWKTVDGERITPDVSPEPVSTSSDAGLRPAPTTSPLQVTEEEVRILKLLAKGHSNPEIAKSLNTSAIQTSMVKTELFNRFGAETNDELVRIAQEKGFISLD